MPFTRNTRLALIAAATLIPFALTAQVSAQTQAQCDGGKIFELLKAAKNDCQGERIAGSGGMRPTDNLARGSAEKEWRREVLTKYGERYQNFNNAVCKKSECVPAAIGGLTRCSVSAIPCARRPVFEGSGSQSLATTNLSKDEIMEIQRLLKVKADGNFGRGSAAALQKWQVANKMVDDGIPTRDILEKLRAGSSSAKKR